MRLFLILSGLCFFVSCEKVASQSTYKPVKEVPAIEVDTGSVSFQKQPKFTNSVNGKPVKVIHSLEQTGFHFYNSVSFKSEKEGIIAGGAGMRIRATKDGGLHWKSFSFSRFANAFYSTAIKNANFYVVGASRYIFRSQDFGEHWEVFDMSTLAETKYELRYPKIYKIKFTEKGFGLAVGGNSGTPVVLRTFDSGNTWELMDANNFNEDDRLLSDVKVFNDQTVRAVSSKGNIYETKDGAKTWSIIYSGKKGESLNSIAFKNKKEGYASGLDGLLLKTTDAGDSWEHINIDTLARNANITNLHYISPTKVVLTTAKSFQNEKFDTFVYTLEENGEIKPFIQKTDEEDGFVGDAYGLFILKSKVFLLDRNKLYTTEID